MGNQAQQSGKTSQIFSNIQVFIIDDFFKIKHTFIVLFVAKINTGNFIVKPFEDNQNRIWLPTENGVNVVNQKNKTFTR